MTTVKANYDNSKQLNKDYLEGKTSAIVIYGTMAQSEAIELLKASAMKGASANWNICKLASLLNGKEVEGVTLSEKKKGVRDIANIIGCSKSTVGNYVKAYEIIEREGLIEAHNEGKYSFSATKLFKIDDNINGILKDKTFVKWYSMKEVSIDDIIEKAKAEAEATKKAEAEKKKAEAEGEGTNNEGEGAEAEGAEAMVEFTANIEGIGYIFKMPKSEAEAFIEKYGTLKKEAEAEA